MAGIPDLLSVATASLNSGFPVVQQPPCPGWQVGEDVSPSLDAKLNVLSDERFRVYADNVSVQDVLLWPTFAIAYNPRPDFNTSDNSGRNTVEMTLRHLVIRELIKEADETGAQIGDRGGLVDRHSAVAEQMFEGLLSAFTRRSSLTHGSFNLEEQAEYPFISAFEAYVGGDGEAEGFLQLADNGMAELARTLSDPTASAASGGYVVFTQYGDERYDYLLVALVRDKSALALDDTLKPTEITQINLDQLHQGARINLTNFRKGRDSYLSFIGSQKKDDITHYFSSAFGCTDVTPSRKSTGELIRAARDFCNDNELYEQKEQIVEDVVSYLERQKGDKQTATLPDLDQVFDAYMPAEKLEEKGTGSFSNFANGEPYEVSQEFQPHTSTINRFAKMKAKADNWQLDFSKRSLGEMDSNKEIEFDEESQTITLRRLPTKVVNQIKEALAQQDAE